MNTTGAPGPRRGQPEDRPLAESLEPSALTETPEPSALTETPEPSASAASPEVPVRASGSGPQQEPEADPDVDAAAPSEAGEPAVESTEAGEDAAPRTDGGQAVTDDAGGELTAASEERPGEAAATAEGAAEGPARPTDPMADGTAPTDGATPTPAGSSGVRIRSKWRTLRGGIAVAFLCGSLGFALAAQLRTNDSDEARFANLRQSDLVRILDELDAREKRLRGEISDLEFRHQTINSKAQGSEAALADAQRRATELGILAGTVPAEGPGLVITLTEKDKPLLADRILDAVQELRGAGAEAMQISGASGDAVRIGASTYFVDAEGGIEVDGKQLAAPYTLTTIGDPPTIDRALKIPGGVVAMVRQDGCDIEIEQRRTVQVTAVRSPRAPRYAKPAS